MSEPCAYTYTDADGDELKVRPGNPGYASLFMPAGQIVDIAAHHLAEFTAATYRAAGQPAPDLPVIYDPALLDALAKDIRYAIEGTGGPPDTQHLNYARVLLAHGWRKP